MTISPAEHDAKQFELVTEYGKTDQKLTAVRERMHGMAGDAKRGYGRARSWGMTYAQVTAKLSQMARDGDAMIMSYGTRPSQALAGEAALVRELARIDGEIDAMETVWQQHRWTRYFPCLNADGHIHSSLRGCPTVRHDTSMGWATDLSGKDVAEAIAQLGPTLCSVCFPDAPAEHCRSRQDITRAERDARKAEREAAKWVKNLRPEEQFRDGKDDRVTTVADCKRVLRDEVELRDYYGRGEHPWHRASVTAAARAAEVLLARGATQAEIDKIIANAVTRNRRLGARI